MLSIKIAKTSSRIITLKTVKHNKRESASRSHIKIMRKSYKMLFNSSDKINREIQPGKRMMG